MTDSPTPDALTDDRPAKDTPKIRRCLKCQTPFHSEWSGERICPRCKTTTAWRQGEPAQSYRVGQHR